MKRVGKPVFFVVVAILALLTYAAFFGVSSKYGDIDRTYIKGADDIRWGIDIRGGVDVTFSPPEGVDATDEEMSAAESVIKTRLLNQNITDSEVYTDTNTDRIIVRFPWKSNEQDFNPEAAIEELGKTAQLAFYKDVPIDQTTGLLSANAGEPVLTGADVEKAEFVMQQDPTTGVSQPVVSLVLKDEAKEKWAEATKEQVGKQISIFMDDEVISAPTVDEEITDGRCVISGNFTAESAVELANQINGGALPFELVTQSYNAISPTLGMGAKDDMVKAGAAAFIIIALFMILYYRLPGFVASIALMGQLAGTIAAITGFFAVFPSFTLTVPGIAGIILGLGFGVDANIISAERIREEIRTGKGIDASIQSGFQNAFSAIFDSNITVVFIAIILMGVFGPSDSIFAIPFNFLFSWMGLGTATAGSVYSFGYTLLVSIILNFLMGVLSSRLMLRSLAGFKPFRKAWLYGGEK